MLHLPRGPINSLGGPVSIEFCMEMIAFLFIRHKYFNVSVPNLQDGVFHMHAIVAGYGKISHFVTREINRTEHFAM